MENKKPELYLIFTPDGDTHVVINAIEAFLYLRLYVDQYYKDREIDLKAAVEELEKEVQENKNCFGVEYMNLRAVKAELLDWDSIAEKFDYKDGFKVLVNSKEVNEHDFAKSVSKSN